MANLKVVLRSLPPNRSEKCGVKMVEIMDGTYLGALRQFLATSEDNKAIEDEDVSNEHSLIF